MKQGMLPDNPPEKEYSGKDCRDCKEPIELFCDFPGPRCLSCHARNVEGWPLERPDFGKAIKLW